MSIYGIGGSNVQRPDSRPQVRDNGRTPAQQGAPQNIPQPSAKALASATQGKPAHSVPVEPPPGTDPALWSVLSSEERAFFAKAGAMGPLTYGRMLQEAKTAQLPAARGGRLDVKI